jgi:proline dehydrogenase
MITDPNLKFDNTQVAFSYKSDKELKKSYLLFSTMDKNLIVKLGSIFIKAALKFNLPVRGVIRDNLFNNFCGGESIEDCEKTIRLLARYNIGTILDYAVEGEKSEQGFDRTATEIIRTIHRAKGDQNIPFCVFKPTGLASVDLLEKVQLGTGLLAEEQDSFQKIRERWDNVCRTAYENNVKIFIDSEDSFIQDPVDEIVTWLMEKYNKEKAVVFNSYQMYRVGMLENLIEAYRAAVSKKYFLGAKLVRGAYMEKERERAGEKGYKDPIQPDKPSTDKAYNEALKFCVDHKDRVAVCSATHNEDSNALLAAFINQSGLTKNDERVYFAQLYGMSDHISFNLASAGYNVIKYVPFGPVDSVMPYLLRRAEENTSIGGQSSREFLLIKKEIKRRKGNPMVN